MNTEATLAIVQLVNNLVQLANTFQVSASELIVEKEKAEALGRTWGQEDVDRLITKSRATINELEERINRGIQ